MVAKKTNGNVARPRAITPTRETTEVLSGELRTKQAPAASMPGSVSSAGKSQPPDPGLDVFTQMGGRISTAVKERHLKILFSGPAGGGKTEMILRNFPGVALFDTEGNSDMCLDHPAIPPFFQVKTKDIRKIQAGIQAARKPVTLPGGVPLQTIGIDSGSILWNEQTDVAAYLAEQRAQRNHKDIDTANITQNDWTKAKRPLKRLMLEFSLTMIPFLVMTAREKDLYEEVAGFGDSKELKKIGVVPDLVKGSIYDFNLAVRLFVENGKRCYEIIKVQGSLGEIFPMGSKGTNFPVEKLLEYAKRLEPGPEDNIDGDDGEVELAARIAEEVAKKSIEHTQANLIKHATEKGFTAAELGAILKAAGFSGFDPSKWEAMLAAIDAEYLKGRYNDSEDGQIP